LVAGCVKKLTHADANFEASVEFFGRDILLTSTQQSEIVVTEDGMTYLFTSADDNNVDDDMMMMMMMCPHVSS